MIKSHVSVEKWVHIKQRFYLFYIIFVLLGFYMLWFNIQISFYFGFFFRNCPRSSKILFLYSIFWQQGTRCCCIDIIRCQTGERGIYNITMNNNTTIQEDLKIHQYNPLFLSIHTTIKLHSWIKFYKIVGFKNPQ